MNILTGLIQHAKNILHLFYPPHCSNCGDQIAKNKIFCNSCFALIKPIASLNIPITSTQTLTVYAAARYEDPLKKLILKKHYGDIQASYHLGNLIIKMLDIQYLKADIIIPTPLHWTRYAQRGFNQAKIMADILGKKMNIPVLELCKRTHKTEFQASLTVEERVENVRHVFAIHKKYQHDLKKLITGKHIIFVDDLYTTGSTLKSLAAKITPYKPSKISALVACRVP